MHIVSYNMTQKPAYQSLLAEELLQVDNILIDFGYNRKKLNIMEYKLTKTGSQKWFLLEWVLLGILIFSKS